MAVIRSHAITLWLDGQLWSSGFLSDPPGTISFYGSSHGYPRDTEFTAETLPEGIMVCPSLALTLQFAPKWAQDQAKECALRYGYKIFEIDLLPWD